MNHNIFNTRQTFKTGDGKEGVFYSLPQLEKEGIGRISRLPISIRIVLESVLRNFDGGKRIGEENILALANWKPNEEREQEIPFIVSRVVLQDFTGVPLLVDLAAMRSAVQRMGRDPKLIEPLVPVDLVIDHSVQVDYSGSNEAFQANLEIEFERNAERYRFLKWGMQAFDSFKVIPPGIGIVHQVNMEYLAKGVLERDGVYFPDTLVGTDSHTTMINGLGVLGWGVGGIEAEAAMLGQPVYFLTPDVVGVHLKGKLRSGVTATDLVLTITEMLRAARVVGKFVEFFGEGARSLPATDRATIANMAPEYGATMGFFPVDEKTLDYFRATGRSESAVETIRNYFEAQRMFGIPLEGEVDYSTVLELDLSSIEPSVAGPKRPQDRIPLSEVKTKFTELFSKPLTENGYNKPAEEIGKRVQVELKENGDGRRLPIYGEKLLNANHAEVGHGDVLIAAITSCTNTSNPSVMLAAGLVAKKAVERGLKVSPTVKTSLAPGSRVVTKYLQKTGLQEYLDKLGFNLVGYGCTTCIGNSGPLHPAIEKAIVENDLVACAVLSGNRNFEARVHQNIKANFLASPPLVVIYALAGTVLKDLTKEPIGKDQEGKDVYLSDIMPSVEEINSLFSEAFDPEDYKQVYSDFANQNPLWNQIPSPVGLIYEWDENSTYIQEPPYFEGFSLEGGRFEDIFGARALAILGDSVTTDHISPAGSIKPDSPAGKYLQSRGVTPKDFNSYGSRRGNHEVMIRGTFANVRIKNLMVLPKEGGYTIHQPDGEEMSIYDAAMRYRSEGIPTVVFAGQEYGTGSSRDWAAKGTRLLGIKAVIAQSFERIHRSNLVGMGVLPLQFKDGQSVQSLGITGKETFDIVGLETNEVKPRQDVILRIHRPEGTTDEVALTLRIDTPIEIEYYKAGGILPFVLRQLLAGA
ncbi:MAG: aconitate hydratase AcnA [Acidobacteria bacterium]|jgi:aconitate hydratase|nr:MAG: aconitate hydratase AcnA [Acidobacteriota bacterium]GIU81555.1 MAG: aconitate hydratase [Pyrinomonadaceae bacterium]